jgi:hypothetical protein
LLLVAVAVGDLFMLMPLDEQLAVAAQGVSGLVV